MDWGGPGHPIITCGGTGSGDMGLPSGMRQAHELTSILVQGSGYRIYRVTYISRSVSYMMSIRIHVVFNVVIHINRRRVHMSLDAIALISAASELK